MERRREYSVKEVLRTDERRKRWRTPSPPQRRSRWRSPDNRRRSPDDQRRSFDERRRSHEENKRYHRNDRYHKRRRRRRVDRRQRYDGRPHRNRSYRSSSSPPQHRRVVTGVVSDDEADVPVSPKKRSSSSCSKDDTVGHFRGGPGTVIDHRYRVLRDVGMGTFGRVVECIDLKNPRRDWRVAIKIVRNVKRYYDSALVEADIVKHVNRRGGRGTSHCTVLFDSFTWNSHYCMVFESLGLSLYDFMKRHKYQPFPPCCVRDFARQLLEALEFMHSFGLIHTDLKPENILLINCREVPYSYRGRTYLIPESTKVKVIDFGGATYDNEKKSCIVATRQYRAPEVLLATGWSLPSDMWSAGCILAELYMGELLFATHDNVEHLALIEKVIGPFPRRMLKRAKNLDLAEEAFDNNGRHRMERVLPPDSTTFVKKTKPLEFLIRKDDRPLFELLRRLLVIDPDNRATGQEGARFRL